MSESKMLAIPISPEDIKFPAPKEGIDQDKALRKREIIGKYSVVLESTSEGNSSCFTGVKFEGIKMTCGFKEDVDAQMFIANQHDKNIDNGAVHTSALVEYEYEQAELKQGTREGLEHLDTLVCLSAVSDINALVTKRLLNNQENREKWPTLRNQIVREQNASDEDIDCHHIERQADSPEKTLERSNIELKERQSHKSDHAKIRKQSAGEMKNIKVDKAEQMIGKKLV